MFLLIKFVKNTKHSEKQGASKCDIILRSRCRGIRLYKKILSSPQSSTELNLNVSLSLMIGISLFVCVCDRDLFMVNLSTL